MKRIDAAVAAYPDSLEIRLVRGQTTGSGLLQLRRSGGGQIRIARVEGPRPEITARWTTDAGPVATVRVIVDADRVRSTGKGDLRVLLAEPPGQQVTIPVAWVIP